MSSVFYGAYVIFEKLRIRDGKPKTKKRLDTEDARAYKGGVWWEEEGGLSVHDRSGALRGRIRASTVWVSMGFCYLGYFLKDLQNGTSSPEFPLKSNTFVAFCVW